MESCRVELSVQFSEDNAEPGLMEGIRFNSIFLYTSFVSLVS